MSASFARRPEAPAPRFGPDSDLVDRQVERHVLALQARFAQDASRASTDVRTLEIQFRLHAPSVPAYVDENAFDVYEEVYASIIPRAGFISQTIRDVRSEADNYNLKPSFHVVKSGVRRDDGTILPLEFHDVTPSIGMRYQRDLHYLRSQRADTILHFGAFEPGTKLPLLYLAFSVGERNYVERSLGVDRSLHGVVLTRAVSVLDLPYNLMSRTISEAVKTILRTRQCDYVETAYNPYLGFNGASFRSSNFVDFALTPVSYYYDDSGSFIPRRAADSRYGVARPAERDTPRNVISAFAVDKKMRKILNGMAQPVQIMKGSVPSRRLSTATQVEISRALASYRARLELGWGPRTVHPDFAGAPHGSPKGQCGVTSVWLARELRASFGIESTYCYGELSSRDEQFETVGRHCWIEIGTDDDPRRIVIDLTADQAGGFDRTIVMQPWSELREDGVVYEPRIRKSLDELANDAVWPRFLYLSDALEPDLAA